jgi:hypothetical protein
MIFNKEAEVLGELPQEEVVMVQEEAQHHQMWTR